MEDSQLKPCPACGDQFPEVEDIGYDFSVICRVHLCGLRGPYNGGMSASIIDWNNLPRFFPKEEAETLLFALETSLNLKQRASTMEEFTSASQRYQDTRLLVVNMLTGAHLLKTKTTKKKLNNYEEDYEDED